MEERGLAQELAIEKVNEDLLYAGFGEAVRAVHGDELAADALELWERHGRRGELEGALDVGHGDVAAAFAWVVLLVRCNLSDDVGGGLVEFVEVVLLGGWFLRLSAVSGARASCCAYQDRRLVRSDHLGLAVAAHEGVPDLVAPRGFVLLHDDEQRAVPPRHAVGLLVPEDQVLKVVLVVATLFVVVGQQCGVDLATLVGGRAYVDLWWSARSSRTWQCMLTTQLGVDTALASQYIW
jgi:hypothetical protein